MTHATAELVRDRLVDGRRARRLRPARAAGPGPATSTSSSSGATWRSTHRPRPPAPTRPARCTWRCRRRSLLPQGSVFVGRDAELERLLEAWTNARAGTRRALFVAGEAGIGKTQLAGELARRLHPTARPCSTAGATRRCWCRTSPFVEALPRYVVGVAARHAARAAPGPAAASSPGSFPLLAAARPRPPRAAAGRARDRALPPVRGGDRPGDRASRASSRSRSCSTTCSGPTSRRCCSCVTCSARRRRARRSCSASTATTS